MKILMMLFILNSCGQAKSDNALLFTQEVLNYNMTRFENSEVICYKQGDNLSCVGK